jgi:hypothetical protein
MHTDAQAPHKIFNLPQQFLVPLFQRRYRWGEEKQWDPLWRDVQRVADRLLGQGRDKVNSHFLGAVVLQFVENPTGSLQEKTIIDGQQRFTTLQLLMDAVHGELIKVGATQAAARLGTLTENGEQFRANDHERFKLRPTHEDRPQFDAVMAAEHPVDYKALRKAVVPSDTNKAPELLMIDAHEFFAARCREWLNAEGDNSISKRAETIDRVLREYLEIVVIDLSADENSQEIFETLNSRGVELTAADLIKNFVFQRLRAEHPETYIESLYNEYWRDFDRLAFWDELESLGRTQQKRSSAFLGYWLTAQTGEETVLSEVFYRFKNLVVYDLNVPMLELLERIKKSSNTYRKLVEASEKPEGNLSRAELFMYRIRALDSNIAKGIVIALHDDERGFSEDAINGVLDRVESWLVRRAILQKSVKRYNYLFAEMVRIINKSTSQNVVSSIEQFLVDQTAETSFWPDDSMLREDMQTRNMYRRRARGRMILEAVEDHYRGWESSGKSSSGTPRVLRKSYSVEHVIPQRWEKNWPLSVSVTERQRANNVHLLGNLTLVTKALNSSLSNDKWTVKQKVLADRDIGFMNKRIINDHADKWDDADVSKRNDELIETVISLWPTPSNHKVRDVVLREGAKQREVLLSHLLDAGYVKVGQVLYPKQGKYAGRNGVITDEGSIELEGKFFGTPSGAGKHLTGRPTAGWSFWLTNPDSKQRLWDVRQAYIESLDPDFEFEDTDDDSGDDDDDDSI